MKKTKRYRVEIILGIILMLSLAVFLGKMVRRTVKVIVKVARQKKL